MKILEQILTAQIDRSLDDRRPLPGWVRWFVRRNGRLRRYYESMQAMEAELRFPENGSQSFRTASILDRPDDRHSTKLIASASIGLLCLLIVSGIVPPQLSTNPNIASVKTLSGSDEVVLTTLSAMASINEIRNLSPVIVPEISFRMPMEYMSLEPVADFAEQPFEQTSILLGRLLGQQSSDLPLGFMEN